MSPRLSRYSEYYRDLDEQQASSNLESLRSRLEFFRLRLDLDHILPWIKGPDVLDFPIGTGRFYPNLIGRFNVHGYDIALRYIERARALHPEMADRFKVCTLEQPDQTRAFDTVITLRTLARVDDTGVAVRSVSSILKPGGRWIFNYPNYEKDYDALPRMFEQSQLRVLREISYDLHAGNDSNRIAAAIYTRYRSLIERHLVPYLAFKAVDNILALRGTRLFVMQKSP